MSEAALRRVAVVLAVLATVTVLGAAGLAGQRYAARDAAAAPTTGPTTQQSPPVAPTVEVPSPTAVPTPSVFPGGRIVFGFADRDAVYEAPSGWTRFQGYRGLEVPDDYVGLLPRAFDPSVYDEGFCGGDSTLPRAYVGWGARDDDGGPDAALAHRAVVAGWRAGYAVDSERATTVTGPRRVRLDDGTPAWVTTLANEVDDDDCPRVTSSETTVLTFANTVTASPAAAVTTLIGYRVLTSGGGGEDVSAARVLRILRTAQAVDQ